MAQACYEIEKTAVGWVVRAGNEAVLICRQKKTAINTARYAGQLMFVDGEICESEVEPCVSPQAHPGTRSIFRRSSLPEDCAAAMPA